MTKDEELRDAYMKLDKAEKRIDRLQKEAAKRYQIEQLLIVAGFVTQEKVNEARDLGDCDGDLHE